LLALKWFFEALGEIELTQGGFITVLFKEGNISGFTRGHLQTPHSKTPPCLPVSQGWRKNHAYFEKTPRCFFYMPSLPQDVGIDTVLKALWEILIYARD